MSASPSAKKSRVENGGDDLVESLEHTSRVEANVPCCICGSEQSELFFERTYEVFRYPGTFSVRECKGCGLLFNSPRLPLTRLPSLYDANYYFFYRSDHTEFQRAANMYLRTVALVETGLEHREVLEIGSAKGYLLALMHSLGWEVQGIDISQHATRYAEQRLSVPTFCGTIEEYVGHDSHRRFPLVLAIDVVEHVTDPQRFMGCLAEVTSTGGVVVIDTPNGGSKFASRLKGEWKGFNPFHTFIYSETNLRQLLESHGFQVQTAYGYTLRGDDTEPTSQNRYLQDALHFLRDSLFQSQACRSVYQKALALKNLVEGQPERGLAAAQKLITRKGKASTLELSTQLLSEHENLVVLGRRVSADTSAK